MKNHEYPRDMVGYKNQPPHPNWPGGAKLAVQFVLNYEEGGENNILHGDDASEAFLSEIIGASAWKGKRHMSMESIYEYGSRVGVWRLLDLFKQKNIPLTIFAVAMALERNPAVAEIALKENHVAAIESDASAYVPRGFGFSGSDEQLEKLRGWLQYFDKNTISYFSKGGGGADIGPLHRSLGTPMFGLNIDGQKYFEMHHTEKDVFELINARELELGTASLASLIFLIDKYGL